MYILPNAFLYKVPEELPLRVAVIVELMAVSYNLDKTKEFFTLSGEGFATGDTVVVQGTGPMGICHVIKARMMGAGDIIATDLSDYRLSLAREFGADYTLNVAQTTAEERIDLVRSLTHGRGADIVVECAGIAEVVPEGLDMLRKGGIYVEAGNFVETGEVSLSPHRHFCSKNVRLIGMTNHPFTGYTSSMEMMHKYSHLFPFDKFVTHEYPLSQTEQALLQSMEPDSMKVVVVPTMA
jgi:L-iditol 2-dehydrogenase